MTENRSDSGQILLITLLILSIATTVALALISRSTTDVNISTQVEESSRAFSAAEAGIERVLKSQETANVPLTALSSGDQYRVSHGYIGGGTEPFYEFPKITQKGKVETLWLVNHDSNGNPDLTNRDYASGTITLCWGIDPAYPAPVPAMVAAFFFIDGGAYNTSRVALDTVHWVI